MADLQVNGARIHYEVQGGDNRETIVFTHSLLFSGRMFDAQVAAFRDRYRCITPDFRGQGQSEVTAAGYDIPTLADDVAALIEQLDGAPCHFVGFSMGGFVGLQLALRRPELLASLILIATSAGAEPWFSKLKYGALNIVARTAGLRAVESSVMPIMFGPAFLADPQRADLRSKWRERLLANDRVGVTRAVTGVFRRPDVTSRLHEIRTPTLILPGEADHARTVAEAEHMLELIPGARMSVIPRAGHMSPVEEPGAVNDALAAFLAAHRRVVQD